MRWTLRYDEQTIRDAVENSPSYAAALRRLGLRPAGANPRTLKRHIVHNGISTDHFNPNWALRSPRRRTAIPLWAAMILSRKHARSSARLMRC